MADLKTAVPETGLGARWRARRATRPHPTVRVVRALTALRLYRPVMRGLHWAGQCFMTVGYLPSGNQVRECSWCGNRHAHHGLRITGLDEDPV